MKYVSTPELWVPTAKYKEISKKISCGSIAEKETCQTFLWQNKEYVATGAVGTGTGIGWAEIEVYQVEELASYKGDLEPMGYAEHRTAVDLGHRERGYGGQLVKSGKRELVFLCQRFTVLELKVGHQLAMFKL